jgi:ferredoxin--NADP+ reductase
MRVFNATLIRHETRAEGLGVLHVRPDEPLAHFHPGQFMMAGLPDPQDGESARAEDRPQKLLKRAYSIASAPTGAEHVEFFVVRVDGGRLTPLLWELKEGDRLYLENRGRGHFTLEGLDCTGDTLVLVATGTGLGPFISMVREYEGRGVLNRIVLLHGVRERRELGYEEELGLLAARNPDFLYLPVLSREDHTSDWTGLRGRVTGLLEPARFLALCGQPLSPETCRVMLCGNPAMIQELSTGLEAQGFAPHKAQHPGRLHYERYW